MDALAAIRFTIARLQVPVAVCRPVAGGVEVVAVNVPCAGVFGAPKVGTMAGARLESLVPGYDHAIMDRWCDCDGVRIDGTPFPVSITVTEVRDDDEHYLLAVFYDRSVSVAQAERHEADRVREVEALVIAQRETQAALEAADAARTDAETSRSESERLRAAAEARLLDQQRLSGQMNLLRQVFAGTVVMVVLLGALVVAQWATGGNAEGLTMVKDILLVMTGILGSAMASMFDSRNRSPNG